MHKEESAFVPRWGECPPSHMKPCLNTRTYRLTWWGLNSLMRWCMLMKRKPRSDIFWFLYKHTHKKYYYNLRGSLLRSCNYSACLWVHLFPNCTQKHVITYHKLDAAMQKNVVEMPLYTHSVQNNLRKRTTSLQRTKWLVSNVPFIQRFDYCGRNPLQQGRWGSNEDVQQLQEAHTLMASSTLPCDLNKNVQNPFSSMMLQWNPLNVDSLKCKTLYIQDTFFDPLQYKYVRMPFTSWLSRILNFPYTRIGDLSVL